MLSRRKPPGYPGGSASHQIGGVDHGGAGTGILKTVLLLIFLFAFSWLLIAPSYLLQPQTRGDAGMRLSHGPVGILPEWVWGTSNARSSYDEVSARALAFEADLRQHHSQIMRRRFELEANHKLWSEEDEESFWRSSFGPGFGLAPKTATPSTVAAAFPTSILDTLSDRTGRSRSTRTNDDENLEQAVLDITASFDKGLLGDNVDLADMGKHKKNVPESKRASPEKSKVIEDESDVEQAVLGLTPVKMHSGGKRRATAVPTSPVEVKSFVASKGESPGEVPSLAADSHDGMRINSGKVAGSKSLEETESGKAVVEGNALKTKTIPGAVDGSKFLAEKESGKVFVEEDGLQTRVWKGLDGSQFLAEKESGKVVTEGDVSSAKTSKGLDGSKSLVDTEIGKVVVELDVSKTRFSDGILGAPNGAPNGAQFDPRQATNINQQSAVLKESAFKHGPALASGWRPVLGHPDSGKYAAKASKTNMAYMEMLEERAVAKPDHTHVILGESSGRLCNQLLSLSTLFTKAKRNGWRVGLWGLWREIVERYFDLDLLRSYGVSFYFQDDRPQSAIRLPAAVEGSCAVRKSFSWLRDYVRPNENLKRMAEAVVSRLREDGQSVVTVHRRWMEGKCVLMTKKGVNHCHPEAKYVIDPNWVCNYTLGPRLEQSMKEEWVAWNTTRSVSMYLSTDSQINASESTYFDPAVRFKRLTTVLRSGYERQPDSTRELPHPDASMVVDMWISTISDFYFGNPLSSCDQVVAQWRASIRASQENPTVKIEDAYAKDVAMYPRGCYGAFGKQENHDDDVCSGIGACTCHW